MNNDLIKKGVEEVISEKELEAKLKSGKKLRIKLGADPSGPDIHLGHAIILRKMKQFQDEGHKIIFLIGDYTAMFGDPSGKNKTRPILSEAQIAANGKTYFDQVGKIIDVEKAEIVRNSEWFKNMALKELINLGSKFSVASIIERDDFEKRLKEGKEISMHELYYPMMQAYDSVVLKADIEFGGTDQRFNMLAGRELQKKIGQSPQVVITTKLLVGTDGKEKMSKSLGNYIGITEGPKEQFGKIMSIPDSLIEQYFELCTDIDSEAIKQMMKEINDGKNPRDYKLKLAKEIVTIYHGDNEAAYAKEQFINQFQKKEIPDEIPGVELSGNYTLTSLLNEIDAVTSNSEAKRLIEQGAVKIDGVKITEINAQVAAHSGMVIQVGKRNFWRVK